MQPLYPDQPSRGLTGLERRLYDPRDEDNITPKMKKQYSISEADPFKHSRLRRDERDLLEAIRERETRYTQCCNDTQEGSTSRHIDRRITPKDKQAVHSLLRGVTIDYPL